MCLFLFFYFCYGFLSASQLMTCISPLQQRLSFLFIFLNNAKIPLLPYLAIAPTWAGYDQCVLILSLAEFRTLPWSCTLFSLLLISCSSLAYLLCGVRETRVT